jgi:hypothetical protein
MQRSLLLYKEKQNFDPTPLLSFLDDFLNLTLFKWQRKAIDFLGVESVMRGNINQIWTSDI